MSLEYSTIVIPLDERQQAVLDQKAAEGWQMVPGVPPVGIWMVCREAAGQYMAQQAGLGTMTIDDSKIFILRNGKYLDKDENEVAIEELRKLGLVP